MKQHSERILKEGKIEMLAVPILGGLILDRAKVVLEMAAVVTNLAS